MTFVTCKWPEIIPPKNVLPFYLLFQFLLDVPYFFPGTLPVFQCNFSFNCSVFFKFCKALPILTTTSHRNQAIRGYLSFLYSSMGDTDEPISILIDELRNEDISSRLKSMSKVGKELFLKAKWILASNNCTSSRSRKNKVRAYSIHYWLCLWRRWSSWTVILSGNLSACFYTF